MISPSITLACISHLSRASVLRILDYGLGFRIFVIYVKYKFFFSIVFLCSSVLFLQFYDLMISTFRAVCNWSKSGVLMPVRRGKICAPH